MRSRLVASVAAGLLVAVGCAQVVNSGHGPEGSSSTAPAIPPRPGIVEFSTDGVAGFAFGRPMVEVLPGLVGLLGEPLEDSKMHGDMPFGYGGMDTTARLVTFDGLDVVFHDWSGYFRDDGVMHLVAWGAEQRRTSAGMVLATPEGISVGDRVAELRTAFGPALHLPDEDLPGCAGPPWYFAVDPNQPWGLIGSLDAPPAVPDAAVTRLSAGAQREGWIPCWQL